jgi:hypothetical protein
MSEQTHRPAGLGTSKGPKSLILPARSAVGRPLAQGREVRKVTLMNKQAGRPVEHPAAASIKRPQGEQSLSSDEYRRIRQAVRELTSTQR